jgi:hypothetical protein
MSLHRLGITKATVGSSPNEVGHALQGWLVLEGRLVNAAHDECFCAYSPLRQPLYPGWGRDSE